MKHMFKGAGTLLGVTMLVALIVTTALATNVGGTYFASNFVDGDDLVLIEDTTIFVNAE